MCSKRVDVCNDIFLVVAPDDSTVIAHAGDGNFHTVILFDPNKEEDRKEAERLNHLMVHNALAMEGTCYSSVVVLAATDSCSSRIPLQ